MNESPEAYPTNLSLAENGDLVIDWSDEMQQTLSAEFLRKQCPCANCMEKRIAMLKDESASAASGPMFPIISSETPEKVLIEGMSPVGNYAYRIDFSDRHTSGVYTRNTFAA